MRCYFAQKIWMTLIQIALGESLSSADTNLWEIYKVSTYFVSFNEDLSSVLKNWFKIISYE